jgi:hypothetical protein
MILIDDDLDSSVDQSYGLSNDFSNNHWQNRTAAVTDEFLKLKFQLETAQRDKERDSMLILSLKHVRIQTSFLMQTFCTVVREYLEYEPQPLIANHVISRKMLACRTDLQLLSSSTEIHGTTG